MARTVGPVGAATWQTTCKKKKGLQIRDHGRTFWLTTHVTRRDLQASDKTLVLADTLTQPCESLSQGPSLAGPGAQSEIIKCVWFSAATCVAICYTVIETTYYLIGKIFRLITTDSG